LQPDIDPTAAGAVFARANAARFGTIRISGIAASLLLSRAMTNPLSRRAVIVLRLAPQ